jgi:uncharacterized protein
MLTQFPGLRTSRFQLTAALTPTSRQNLSALLTGVLGADGRLKLELLELPRDSRIPGPGQAQQTMATDDEVISRVNLLKQGGHAKVVYGNLLALPYAGGLFYVQPSVRKELCHRGVRVDAAGTGSYGSLVGYETTAQAAINALMKKAAARAARVDQPGGVPSTAGAPQALMAEAAAKIEAALAKLRAAQKAGDFAAVGTALNEMETAIRNFETAKTDPTGNSSPTPTAAPSSTGQPP